MKRILSCALITMLLLFGCSPSAPTWQEQYDLGMKYLLEGNYEEAIVAFTSAIETDPSFAAAFIGRGDAYIAAAAAGADYYEKAINDYREAIRIGEPDAELHVKLGNACVWDDRDDDAIKAFSDAIDIDNAQIEARIERGKLYEKKAATEGDNQEKWLNKALADYLEAIEIDKKMVDVYVKIADIYLALDSPEQALEILKRGYEETKDENLRKRAEELKNALPEMLSFARKNGFQFVLPHEMGAVPARAYSNNEGVIPLSVTKSISNPVISCSEPDASGYVTYTIERQQEMTISLDANSDAGYFLFHIESEDWAPYDYYTGMDLCSVNIRTMGDAQESKQYSSVIDFLGEKYEISVTESIDITWSDWERESRSGGEIMSRNAHIVVTDVVYAPLEYDGLIFGIDPVSEMEINEDPFGEAEDNTIKYWDSFDDVDKWEFFRVSYSSASVENYTINKAA